MNCTQAGRFSLTLTISIQLNLVVVCLVIVRLVKEIVLNIDILILDFRLEDTKICSLKIYMLSL